MQLIAMEVVAAVAVLILTVIFYAIYSRYKRLRDEGADKKLENEPGSVSVVLFIDAPDPDNLACAASLVKHVLAAKENTKFRRYLHIVLTGRPVNLRTEKNIEGALSLETFARQAFEENDPRHAHMVLEDAAARLENYLTECDIDFSMVAIYDGGVAPCAPISDRVHDWDFLFDRKDLISGLEGDCGSILTPEQYSTLVAKISALSEDKREKKLTSVLRTYPLVPLSTLMDELEEESVAEVVLFLGGPATALVELFKGQRGSLIRPKVVGVYGMFGSLEPGKSTILPNQFNVACDVEAASNLFVSNLFPEAEKYLITTETAKSERLIVSYRDLEKIGAGTYFTDLQRLWESTHGEKPQPMFDVLPIMAFLKQFRGYFKWSRKKAVLQEVQKGGTEVVQIFSFADTDNHQHPLVSGPTHNTRLNKAKFLEFLRKTWESA